MWKRLLCTAVLACSSSGVWGASGEAGAYPSKPIRLIDGFQAGGGVDFVARAIVPRLSERIGQTVIIDNRPGASGNLGAQITARAIPDGYTLFIGTSLALASSPSLYPNLGYDPVKDFTYISIVVIGTYLLVAHPSVPAKSVSELVAFARTQPQAIRYGSAGVASPVHLAGELLKSMAGMELLHVPYKGGAPAVIALTGGEVEIVFSSVSVVSPLIKAKRLNALAVTGSKRLGVMPEVPTVAESGFPGFNVTAAYGILAPSGTSASVVKLLSAEIKNVVQLEDVRTRFDAQALETVGSTPDEFSALMRAETVRWARVIKDANIRTY